MHVTKVGRESSHRTKELLNLSIMVKFKFSNHESRMFALRGHYSISKSKPVPDLSSLNTVFILIERKLKKKKK